MIFLIQKSEGTLFVARKMMKKCALFHFRQGSESGLESTEKTTEAGDRILNVEIGEL